MNRRELKVDYASDNKNGVNLKAEDVRFRDVGEIVNENLKIIEPSKVNFDEALRGLSSH